MMITNWFKRLLIFKPKWQEGLKITKSKRTKTSKQFKSSWYSRYYVERWIEWRLSPPLSAWTTQLRRNVAAVASRTRPCVQFERARESNPRPLATICRYHSANRLVRKTLICDKRIAWYQLHTLVMRTMLTRKYLLSVMILLMISLRSVAGIGRGLLGGFFTIQAGYITFFFVNGTYRSSIVIFFTKVF